MSKLFVSTYYYADIRNVTFQISLQDLSLHLIGKGKALETVVRLIYITAVLKRSRGIL